MSRGIGTISEWFLSSQLKAGTKVVDVGAGNANLTVTLAEVICSAGCKMSS